MSSAVRYVVGRLVSLLPPTRAFKLKAQLWRLAGIQVSPSARIVSSACFHTNGRISIGQRTFVGHEVLFVSGEADINIGNDVDIAPRVLFAGGTHEIDLSGPRSAGLGLSKPITVSDGAWIGAHSTVLGGVTIGKKAVIAAGSLVNRDVPAYSLVGGVPCRMIRMLNEPVGATCSIEKSFLSHFDQGP
jgi:acetyltransferase-like isoleucine patch superfamily enzyme